MEYPTLKVKQKYRQMEDAFLGYNHNLRIQDGEFFEMKNMTSDYYPILSPRNKRGIYKEGVSANGIIAKDALCYVDGSTFYINEYPVDMGLNEEPKQLISMGAYVIIMPDKKYINTANVSDYGNIEAEFTTNGKTTISLCKLDGSAYGEYPASPNEPLEPKNLDLWVDTSTEPHALKQYSESAGMWVSIATTYAKISHPGIGIAFEKFDGIEISGLEGTGASSLNGAAVIWEKDDDYIVVDGILDTVVEIDSPITISRKMPKMDFVIECKNRLWGCRYGTANNGEIVNEIYSSKLGDFKNWNCVLNISTDSWVGSVGTDGQFTGAIAHMGYPMFFKENVLHKVYINGTGTHSVQDTACRGVQKDCHKSLAIVNETLFYKARSGVVAYDGSLPTEASSALGNEVYSDAVGGSHGNKYYVSMKDSLGAYHLFVYDVAKGMWHREDDLRVDAMCSCRGELYAIEHESKQIIALLGSGKEYETNVEWMVQTGEIGISSPDMKYISRMTVRLMLEPGSQAAFYAQYDLSNEWEPLFTLTGTSLRSFSVPIRPKRCDHMKLRIEGEGVGKIYSITKTIERGSELS